MGYTSTKPFDYSFERAEKPISANLIGGLLRSIWGIETSFPNENISNTNIDEKSFGSSKRNTMFFYPPIRGVANE